MDVSAENTRAHFSRKRGIHRGPMVLTCYYALCDADVRRERDRLLAAGRDAWADVALADLSRAHLTSARSPNAST
jgi:hypothetical protein